MRNYFSKNYCFFYLIFFILSACGKSGVPENGSSNLAGIGSPPTLYAAGSHYRGHDALAVSWKNAVRNNLSNDTEDAQVLSTFVSNGVLYQAGYFGFYASVWRNGERISLTDGRFPARVNSIFVVGTDFYAVGEDGYDVAFWKNGVKTVLNTTESGTASSVYVLGEDVYVAGYVNRSENDALIKDVAVLWKNPGENVVVTDLSDGSFDTRANSVFVTVSGNVYVSGKEMNSTNYEAVLWKDSAKTVLSDPTKESSASVVYVSGDDVYVGGYEGNVSTVWKNPGLDVEKVSLSDGSHPAGIHSLITDGVHFYAAGFENNGTYDVAVLWQGVVKYNLTSGTRNALATSVFVDRDDVYVGGVEKYTDSAISRGTIWDGTHLTELDDDSEVRSVFVSGTDVHAVGSVTVGGVLKAAYWKNGKLENSRVDAEYSSILVSDSGDIYVGGSRFNGTHNIAVVWKNLGPSEVQNDLSDGSEEAALTSLFVDGSNVYAAGFNGNRGAIWINVNESYVTVNPVGDVLSVRLNSIFVSEGSIYVAGYEELGPTELKAVVWKNSQKLYDFPISGGSSTVVNLFVSGQDVYSVGSEYNGTSTKAILWKNDQKTYLTDGTHGDGAAEAVAVDGTDVYVGGYEGSIGMTWKNGVRTLLGTKNPTSITKIYSIFLKKN
jgi:hypothetical protein